MPMSIQTLNGDQAMAFGALSCGIKLVTSYPGSPSSGTVETLISQAKKHKIYVGWSSNEKVAMEMGIGASIAGRRALVCTKSVGLNAMIDPLMALNLTPVHGGLVILLGDDPGGYGSQNDQDSRPLADLLEMPMLEPASPAEGYAMMQEAFSLSEKFNTAVIIRVTRSFVQQEEPVSVSEERYPEANLGLVREPFRFVPVPINAVEKHGDLHRRIEAVSEWADSAPFNRISGAGVKGIISAGFAHRKLLDVVGEENPGEFRLLKLGVLYPLPQNVITQFLQDCDEVLILEEIEPYVETRIKAIAHDAGCLTKIYGKQSRHIGREGELFRWQIQSALAEFIPEFVPKQKYLKRNELEETPKMKDHCADCQYDKVLDRLEEAAESLGQKLMIIGDPGCLVTVAGRLDAKYALGSAVSVADGLSKAGVDERAVALFGDSAFFHSALPAVANAVHNQSNILMVVLDNKATATSGFQVNPGVGRDAMGREVPALDIEQIARACGVKHVYTSGPEDLDSTLKDTFREALSHDELTLIIVRLENRTQ
jgi:indolepyruvate ferredoxin oxidoreductase alpha subunit